MYLAPYKPSTVPVTIKVIKDKKMRRDPLVVNGDLELLE
jgi:hypothetical protein